MPIEWDLTDPEQHEQLAPRSAKPKDPEWEAIMVEIERGEKAVTLRYADEKERGTLARSIGRRAAHRGFKVDIRRGDGFISVRKLLDDHEPASASKPRRG